MKIQSSLGGLLSFLPLECILHETALLAEPDPSGFGGGGVRPPSFVACSLARCCAAIAAHLCFSRGAVEEVRVDDDRIAVLAHSFASDVWGRSTKNEQRFFLAKLCKINFFACSRSLTISSLTAIRRSPT